MKDVKVTRRKNILPIIKVTKISTSPPILEVLGNNFTNADQVRLNDTIVYDWVLAASDRILITIPKFLLNITIDTITILTDSLQSGDNYISFEINNVQSIQGIDSLLQHFIKILLQTPSSNKFNSAGGGVLKLAGKNSVNYGRSIKVDLIEAVARTRDYILKSQSNKNVPLVEKLSNAEIIGLSYGADPSELILSILVTNSIGQSARANITP